MSDSLLEQLPRPAVMPASLSVEAAGESVILPLIVLNRGGGNMNGELSSSAGWIRPNPTLITQNKVKVDVEVRLDALPLETWSEAELTLKCGETTLRVPVRVRRFGFGRALESYRRNDYNVAKDVCRRIIAADARDADAPLLLASIYLEERNFPSALKVLQEFASAGGPDKSGGVAEELPDSVIETIVNSLRGHTGSLRSLDHGIPVYERMLLATGAGARPRLLDALRQAYVEYLQEFMQERRTAEREDEVSIEMEYSRYRRDQATPASDDVRPSETRLALTAADEIARLRGYVQRAARHFPQDDLWPRLEGMLRKVQRGHVRERVQRVAVVAGGVLAVVLVCVAALYIGMRLHMRSAARAVERGDYASAVASMDELLALDGRLGEARDLRARANFLWSKTLFEQGEPQFSADKLEAALRDAPADPQLLSAKQASYKRWGEQLLRQGRFKQAYEKYRVVAELAPQDRVLTRKLQSLRPWHDLYAGLADFEHAPDAARPARAILDAMRKAGLQTYDTRMQALWADLDGDGRDELALAGTSAGRGGLHIYRAAARESADAVNIELEPRLTVQAGADPWLRDLTTRKLSAGDALTLIADWMRGADSKFGHSVLAWEDAGKLRAWSPPQTIWPIEFRDRNQDGQPELWIRRLYGNPADTQTAASLPVPHRWVDGRVVPIAEYFSDYYLDEVVPDLERAIKAPPYPVRDARRARWIENHRQAAAAAVALARK